MHPPDADIVVATHQVIAVLEQLEIPYCVGGSLASSYHGIPRATIDGEIVIAPILRHCRLQTDALADVFVVDLEVIVNAIHNEGSFNAIHRELLCKVDVFIAKSVGWNQSQLARRQLGALGINPDDRVFVSSPEDSRTINPFNHCTPFPGARVIAKCRRTSALRERWHPCRRVESGLAKPFQRATRRQGCRRSQPR